MAESNTIFSGTADSDLISVGGSALVLNFGDNDSLKISDGVSITSHYQSGSNYIINTTNGTVTLRAPSSYDLKANGNILHVENIPVVNAVSFYEIRNSYPGRRVEGSSGNDRIVNSGSGVTIQSKDGDDIIEGSDDYGEVFLFGAGEGNNTIVNFADNDTINITNGTPSITTVGNDIIINITGSGGAGTVRLVDAASKKFNNNGGILTVANAVNRISNHDNGEPIDGTAGNDLIINSGDNVTITPGRGNDTVEPSSFGELFVFGARDGNNVITNFGANDTILIGLGSISGSSVSADGNDYIITIKRSGDTSRVTLKGAGAFDFDPSDQYLSVKGGDEIFSSGARTMLNGTNGSDRIINEHSRVTIRSGAGNDTIEGSRLYGDLFQFAPGDGDNVILNFAKDDTIMALGNGTVTSEKFEDYHIVTIRGENSSATVKLENTGNLVIKSSGGTLVADDANYISITQNTVVTGTADKDYIENISGARVTIRPNGSNDTVIANDLYGEMFVFAAPDGNNLIRHFGKNDTIRITDGSIQHINREDNDYVIYLAKNNINGTIRLENAGDFNLKQDGQYLTVDTTNYMFVRNAGTKFDGTDGNDLITNNLQGVSIQSGGGNDTIIGADAFGEVFMFSAADGDNVITNFGRNDTIFSSSGSMTYSKSGDDYVVTIRDGNKTATVKLLDTADYKFNLDGKFLTAEYAETISNSYDNVALEGTAANDRIFNYGEHVTVHGGTGNDTITGSDAFGELYQFSSAEDNNVITNFGLNDTLRMTAGKNMTWSIDGDDVVVTLKGTSYTGTVRLQNTATYDFKKTSDGKTLYVGGVNTINNSANNANVPGTNSPDYIINSGSNVTVDGKGGDDTIEGSDFGEMFVVGAINGNDRILDFGVNDTLRAVNGTIERVQSVGDDAIVIVRQGSNSAAITLGGAGSYDLDWNSDGIMTVVGGGGSAPIINYDDNVPVDGTANDDYIINAGQNVSIKPGQGNDTIEGSSFAETFLLSSSDGNNVITNFGANDTLRMTAGKNIMWTTVGSDVLVTLKGNAYTGIETLLGAAGLNFTTVKSGSIYNLIADNGIPTLINSRDNTVFGGTDDAEYMINTGDNVTINGGGGGDTIEGSAFGELYYVNSAYGDNVILDFGENDSISMTAGKNLTWETVGSDVVVTVKGNAYTGTVTLKDAAGLDLTKNGNGKMITVTPHHPLPVPPLIVGTSGADYIDAGNGDGNHTIDGRGGDDTIIGSDYGDLFYGSSAYGNNLIKNFDADDTLRMIAGKTMTWETVGADVVVTLKGNAYTGKVTLEDAAGMNFVKSAKGSYLYVDSGPATLTNYSDRIKFSGSEDAEYLINYGSGVTIDGKGGGDTIYGSDSSGDLYLFSSAYGDNVILNFGENDSISMTAGRTLSYGTVGDDVIVTLKGTSYTGTVTLKDAAGMNFVADGGVFKPEPGSVTLTNFADATMFNGTEGTEYMINSGERVTIDGKGGGDTIEGSDFGEMYYFSSGYGHNVITNFGKNDSLRMTAGKTMTWATLGSDVIVTLKGNTYTGTVTLQDAANNKFVKSADGKYLYIDSGPATLTNVNNNRAFNGTSDAEYMINSGDKVTIDGKGGGDTIEGSDFGEMYYFSSGYGHNVITNFDENDTLRMTAGKNMTWATVGSDVIVTVKGNTYTGTVTLQDAAGLNIVKSANGSYLYVDSGPATLTNVNNNRAFNGTSDAEYIVNSGDKVTIDGKGGGDTIVGSGFADMYYFSSAYGNNVITNFDENDTLRMTAGKNMTWATVGADVVVTLKGNAYSGTVTLKDAAGLNIVKSANGSYLYVDSGPDTLTNANNNRAFNGTSDAEYMINSGDKVTIDGKGGGDTIVGSGFADMYYFSSAYGNNVITNFDENDTLRMTAGKNMTWATVGSDVIVTIKGNAYSGTVTLQDAAGLNIVKSANGSYLYVDNGPDTLTNYRNNTLFGGTEKDEWLINSGSGVSINPGAGDDTIVGSDAYGEMFMIGSGHGNNVITNFGEDDTLFMSAGVNMSFATVGSDVVVTLKGNAYTGTVTLENAAGNKFVKSANGKYLTIDNGPDTLTNYNDNILFGGTEKTERLINLGSGVTIDGGGGGDTIEGSNFGELYLFSSAYGDNVILDFGENDSISMTAGKTMTWSESGNDVIVTLKGTAYTGTVTLKDAAGNTFVSSGKVLTIHNGPATLTNFGNNIKFNGTSDAEYMLNYSSSNVTINAGAGDDSIVTAGDNVSINGGTDNDYIENQGEYVSINGGTGDDSIENHGYNVSINGGTGDDSIYNDGENVSIDGGAGDDTIKHYGENNAIVSINGGDGNDYITALQLFNSTIRGGAGNDTIWFDDDDSDLDVIHGDAGNDYIANVYSSTVYGDAGNDTIIGGRGNVYMFGATDGNDVIVDFDEDSTIRATSGTLTGGKVGSDYVVTVKSGSSTGTINLKGAGSLNFISTGSYLMQKPAGVSLTNSTANTTLTAGYGDDTIYNDSVAGSVVINALSGNDSIKVTGGRNVTVNAGDGNDTVYNGSGSGSSAFDGYGKYMYVDLGAGNDYLYGDIDDSTLIGGKGNDTFTDYDGGNNTYLYASGDGNDVILTFAYGDKLVITDGSIRSHYSDSDGYVINVNGNGGSGQILLKDTYGIDVGSSGGNIVVTTYDDEDSDWDDEDSDWDDEDSDWDDEDSDWDYENYTDSRTVTGSSYADRIYNDGSHVTINAGAGDDYIQNDGQYVSINGGTGNDEIFAGALYDSTIRGGAGNDSIWLDDGDSDRDVIHGDDGNDYIANAFGSTIYGDAGNDTIVGSYGNVYMFGATDGNDVIVGFDEDSTIRITDGSSYSTVKSGNDVLVNVGNGSIRLKNYSSTINISGGTATGVSLNNTVTGATVNGTSGNDTIYNNNANYAVINTGDGADSIRVNSGRNVTVNAGDGNDTVYNGGGYGQYMRIDLGAGNDYLYGDVDYSTLVGGKGNDTFTDYDGGNNTYLYASGDGNDVIRTFAYGDELVITDGSIRSHYSDGEDYVINVNGSGGSGQILLQDTYGIDVGSSGGNIVVTTYDDEDSDWDDEDSDWDDEDSDWDDEDSDWDIENYTDSRTLTGTNYADSIYNEGSYVTINAGAGDDYIYNEYGECVSINGGAGNDYIEVVFDYSTLVGGKGNDTFTDEDGDNNTYLYASGDGNDVIYTFAVNDKLVITDGSISSHYADGDDYVISVVGSGGSGQILLKYTYEIDVGTGGGNIVVTNYYEGDDEDSDWELAPDAEDYWFEKSAGAIDEIGAMLEEIPLNDEAAIGSLSLNFDPTTLLTPASSAAVKSARHLKK